jgi:hypothetical protein
MKLNFPASGSIVVHKPAADAPTRFLTAPLEAKFPLQPGTVAKEGQNYALRDEAGTALIYRITGFEWFVQDQPLLIGSLVAVEHTEQNVVSNEEHEAKLSTMIDQAFEAGRQVAHQERADEIKQLADDLVLVLDEPANAFVRFGDGSNSMFFDVRSILNVDGELSLETTVGSFIDVHPSWRSYELLPIVDEVDEDDDDVELINPLSVKAVIDEACAGMVDEELKKTIYSELVFKTAPDAFVYDSGWLGGKDKGEVVGCGCGACDAASEEDRAKAAWGGIWADKSLDLSSMVPAGTTLLWKPRFGPIGNRIDDE